MRPHVVLSCLVALACVVSTPNAAAQNGLPPGKWTVIVHGRETGGGVISCHYPETYEALTAPVPGPDGYENWMYRLAETIELTTSTPVNVYRMSASTLQLDCINGGTTPDDTFRHHVLLFDWAQTSGIIELGLGATLFCPVYTGGDDGFAYAAGEALYATLRKAAADQRVFALIGYSRGSVVASELTKRLIGARHDPRQVIFVDGEGADGSLICGPPCDPPAGPPGSPLNRYRDGDFDAWQHSGLIPIRYDNIYEMFNEDYGALGICFDLGGHCKTRCTNYDLECAYAHTPFLGYFGDCDLQTYSRPGIWEHLVSFMDSTGEGGIYMFPGAASSPTDLLRSITPADSRPLLFNGDFEFDPQNGSIAGWFGNGGGPAPYEGGTLIGTFGGTFALSILQGASHAHSYFAMPNRECLLYFDAARAGIAGFGNDEFIIAIYSPELGEVELVPRLGLADDLGDTLQNYGPYIVPPAFRGKACSLIFIHTAGGGAVSSVWLDNVTLTAIGPPPNPANPIIVDSSCGNATLGFSGSPPPGVSWFWQHQICATRVDLGSEPTFTAHTIGTYYLKARCDQTGAWSAGCGSVQVTEVGDVPTGDVDSNGSVDLTDLAILLAHFGTPSGASRTDGDLDGDGDVDLTDLSLLLSHFGESCPNTPPISIDVLGTANPYLAGMPAGATGCGGDSAPMQSPVLVSVQPGEQLSFSASGLVNVYGSPPNTGPEGNASIYWHCASQNGIANLRAPEGSLLGVFLGPDTPDLTPAPTELDFETTASRDYATLAPQLKQVFFVGDGQTGGGVIQRVTAPTGATRLFVGIFDGGGWRNNTGAFQVTVSR